MRLSGRTAAAERAKAKKRANARTSGTAVGVDEEPLSREETLKIALKTASKLGHRHMEYMISSRLGGEFSYTMQVTEERPQMTLSKLGSPSKYIPLNATSQSSSNEHNELSSSSKVNLINPTTI